MEHLGINCFKASIFTNFFDFDQEEGLIVHNPNFQSKSPNKDTHNLTISKSLKKGGLNQVASLLKLSTHLNK